MIIGLRQKPPTTILPKEHSYKKRLLLLYCYIQSWGAIRTGKNIRFRKFGRVLQVKETVKELQDEEVCCSEKKQCESWVVGMSVVKCCLLYTIWPLDTWNISSCCYSTRPAHDQVSKIPCIERGGALKKPPLTQELPCLESQFLFSVATERWPMPQQMIPHLWAYGQH